MANLTEIPVPRPGYHVEEMDEEAVLYSRTRTKAIYLNETARVIWQLCDGERSIGTIVEILSAEFPEAATSIERDVIETIERLTGEAAMRLKTAEAAVPPQ